MSPSPKTERAPRRFRPPGALAVALALACGRASAPQELHNARHAYNQAEQGVVVRFAPSELETARQALEEANRAYATGEPEAVVQDLAYIAERQVALAASTAALQQATQSIEAYEEQHRSLTRQIQLTTQAELEETRRKLAEAEAARERLQASVQSEREARLAEEGRVTSALQSLQRIAGVQQEPRGLVVTLQSASLFAPKKSTLLPGATQKLGDVARALLTRQAGRMVVEGHTDSRGDAKANRALSLKRAKAVRSYLIGQGIPSASIRALGRGERTPIVTNKTAAGRNANSRVEIVVNWDRQTEPAPR